ERILAETRRNLDPIQRRADQQELARRVMSLPGSDPIEKWRAEGEASDAARAAAKRERVHERDQEKREAAEAASISTKDWAAWVTERIKEEREFILEVCGSAIGELTGTLHREFEDKIDELKRDFERERDAHRRELSQVDVQAKAIKELNIREL